MNYQGVTGRTDIVAFLCVFWFLVTYYPILSMGLIACLLISTFWEKTVYSGKVMVNYFKGTVKDNKNRYEKNIAMNQTTIGIPKDDVDAEIKEEV